MQLPRRQVTTPTVRSLYAGRARQLPYPERPVPRERPALPRDEAPGRTSAGGRGFAEVVLGVVLLVAPFASIVALREAIGHDFFLGGVLVLVGLLLLVGLGEALVRAALGHRGRAPTQAGAPSVQIPPVGVAEDRARRDNHPGSAAAA